MLQFWFIYNVLMISFIILISIIIFQMSEENLKQILNQNKQPNQEIVQVEQQQLGLLNLRLSEIKYDQQRKFSGVCSFPMIFTAIFCLIFSVIWYRYVAARYDINKYQSQVEAGLFSIERTEKISDSEGHLNEQLIKEKEYLIPSKLWVFNRTTTSLQSNNILKQQTCNLKHYSSLSQFQFRMITLQNFKFFINDPYIQRLVHKIKQLKITREQQELYSELLIMLSVMQQNGGIMLGEAMIATGDLTWIHQLSYKNKYHETYMYMDRKDNDPSFGISLQGYFIASTPKNKFIKQFIRNIFQVIQQNIAHRFKDFHSQDFRQRFKDLQSQNVQLQRQNIELRRQKIELQMQDMEQKLNNVHVASLESQPHQGQKQYSTHLSEQYQNMFNQIIKRKTRLLKSIGNTQKNILSYLRIYNMGNLNKLSIYENKLLNLTLQNHFKYLYSVSQQELQNMIGPINPVLQLITGSGQKYLQKQIQRTSHEIVKGSFICNHLQSWANLQCLQRPKNNRISNKQWNVPRLVWTFLQTNQEENALNDYFLQNLLEISQQSNFQLLILTPDNLDTVLQKTDLEQITGLLQNVQQNQRNKLLSQIIKLKILKKFGGIFVDPNWFVLQNLEWLINVPLNKFVFNKWSDSPQVFMFHNHSNFDWFLNKQSPDIKESLELDYQSQFIAANKNSPLINDWLNQLGQNLKMSKIDLKQKMEKQCLSKFDGFQSFFQQTLKCVIKKRQLKLNNMWNTHFTSSAKFYKLWSMSSLFAGSKMNIVLKEENKQCFLFDESYNKFVGKYGGLGYISQLIIDGSQQQLQSIKHLSADSIYKQFFTKKQIDNDQKNLRKSKNMIKSILGKV